MPKIIERWLLFKYVDGQITPLSKPFNTRAAAAERSLRTVVLGRKNYLFYGSDAGGERAATPKRTCAKCSPASPIIPSAASKNCCHGTSQRSSLETPAARHSRHSQLYDVKMY
jgi:hypothetical protein